MAFYRRRPDIIIRGGTVVDGSGNYPYYADIAVIGDKIDYIGDLTGVSAPLEIDARGKYVTPGFIDSHTHGDKTIYLNPEAQSSVRQGVTTEVVGNCGTTVLGIGGRPARKGDFAAALDKVEDMGASINTVWLCGHGTLREAADLYTEDYTEEQFETMAGLLKEAMDAGYAGFSTGLEFVPGITSRPEEVERLAAVAAEYDANYSSHMRDEGTYILEAIEEFLNVVRKTGMRGTVSHLNVKYDNGIPNEYLQRGMDMLKEAREKEHLNVYCDMLPNCFAPGGAMAILPPWLYENGWEDAREKLKDPAVREKVKGDLDRYWRFLGAGGWDRLLYICPTYMPDAAEIPFAELCKKLGHPDDPVEAYLDIMAAAPDMKAANDVIMIGQVFFEQTLVDSVVKDPIYMWMTDSETATEEGPAREATLVSYMSTMQFLIRYIRERKDIPIEKAMLKMASVPAQHFHIKKRGLLTQGYYADINVFDINELKINATFAHQNRYSSGMDYVIVNGVPVIAKGEHTGARPGHVLRHLPEKP